MSRLMEFSAGSYKFKYGATLQDEFDLKAKLDEIEGDIDDLEADGSAATNAQVIADEAVARASASSFNRSSAAMRSWRALLSRSSASTSLRAALEVLDGALDLPAFETSSPRPGGPFLGISKVLECELSGLHCVQTRPGRAPHILQSQCPHSRHWL